MIARLENISKYYESESTGRRTTVLENISLTVHKDDSISIVGPSGSGKSTLLNILGTLDAPSHGNVFFLSKDVSKMNGSQLSQIRNENIGFIFQMHHLLPQLSLIENVLIPTLPFKDTQIKQSAAERGMTLLDSVGLAGKASQRPGQCSVGECQRAAVVRALINEPDLILADEPTGSLDQESAEKLGQLLSNIQKEKHIAMIIVTHSLSLAKMMNKTYKLEKGKLVEIYSP